MEKKTIMIKSQEELESINSESIRLDSALFEHRKSICYLIDMLTAEKKAIDSAILDKVEHQKVKTSLFYTVISDYFEFNSDEFVMKYGQKEYDSFKTRPVHREQVRTK